MPSDIILEENWIRLEGPSIDMHGHTVVLDNILPRGSTTNSEELRRPLVHDAGDSLTINWGQKYAGGVTIFGAVSVPGTLTLNGAVSVPGTLSLTGSVRVNIALPAPAPAPAPAPSPATGAATGAVRPGGVVLPAGTGAAATNPATVPGAASPVLVEAANAFATLAASPTEVELRKEIQMVRIILKNFSDRIDLLEKRR